MADRVICMMLGSPLTEYSVHLFKQSIQSCTLPSARKPVYRALCIVSLKHSAEYSVWSIQSAYYHLQNSGRNLTRDLGAGFNNAEDIAMDIKNQPLFLP